MNTQIPIIATKLLIPSSAAPRLMRDHLVQRLQENTNKRISLLCAGAGYGKTEVVSSFAKNSPHPIIWYTLDYYDNDETIFSTHLAAGLQQVFPHIDRDISSLQVEGIPRQRIVGQFVEHIQSLSQPLIIVLDNFQEIEDDSSTSAFVDLLLTYAPAQLHVVITSRKMPCLGQLARLHNREEAIVFTEKELSFTTEEIQALHTLRSGLELPRTIAQQLNGYTAGWPLSVDLTLKLFEAGNNKTVNATAVNQQLLEYLKSELWFRHPERVQSFLRDTAIFKQFTPMLAAESVLGYEDAPALIAYLQRHNLFLSNVDDDLYAYPQQIRELLQQELIIANRDKYLSLHRQAARYFEAKGQLAEALEHYQQAEDHEAAMHLLENLAEEMLNNQHLEKLQGWLQCLTPKSQTTQPKFLLYRAQLQARLGRPQEALASLGEARRALKTHQPRYQMMMLAQMGIIHVQQGDYATASRLLQQARQVSTQDTVVPPDLDFLTSSLMAVSENVSAAVETCQKSLYQYEIQADLYGQVQAMIHLAGLAVDLGQITRAGTLLSQSAEIMKQLGTPVHLDLMRATMAARRFWLGGDLEKAEQVLIEHSGLIQDQAICPIFLIEYLQIQGAVYRDQGEWAKAEECFEAALDISIKQQAWALKSGIIEDMAWLQFRQGNLEQAEKLAQQAETLLITGNVRQYARVYMLLGVLARSKGRYQEALFQLENAREIFETLDLEMGLWSSQLHLAQTYFDLGYEEQALEYLTQALTFARKNHIAGGYFWDPALVAQLCLVAITKNIEVPYATCLAAKLADFLMIDVIVNLMKQGNTPQDCLPCIHLLQAVGTPEAQRHLQTFAANTTSPQAKTQAERAMTQLTAQSPIPDLPEIRIYCLGNLRVERNGQPIEGDTWAGKSKAGRQKVKTLLAYLVERGSQGATKDELIEALWGAKAWGRDEARLESSLARTLSALRQALEPDLLPPATSSFIISEEGRYYLNSSLCWIDVEEFQDLIKEARDAKLQGEPEAAQATYQKALVLYRDEYLRDIPTAEEWAGLQRYALSQQLGVALMSVADYYMDQGNIKEALVRYREAIEQEPTNHMAHYRLIDALRQENHFEEATLAYQRCRKIFNQEVDEEPPEAITELYENIQKHLTKTRSQELKHYAPRKQRVKLSFSAS